MNRFSSIFSLKPRALRPPLACEITPSGVMAGARAREQKLLFAFEPLQPGALSTGVKTVNLADRAAVAGATQKALNAVRQRENVVTIVIPDSSVRVLIIDFESLPAKAADVLPIIRFRLRKLVPFETEDAGISYQLLPNAERSNATALNAGAQNAALSAAKIRLVAAVTPKAILTEYEAVVREAGFEPGAVIPSTLAALALVDGPEASLVVNRNSRAVTTAITRQNELLLHRTLDLGDRAVQEGRELSPIQDDLPLSEQHLAVQELQECVNVAIAYFEDTLGFPPRQLLSCGPGGAEELLFLLGEYAIPAMDLGAAPAEGNATPIPRGLLAGVRGALAG